MECVLEIGHRVTFAKNIIIIVRHKLHTYCVHIRWYGSLSNYSSLSWWRHRMETFSTLLALCVGIHRSPLNSPHKGQWWSFDVFFDLRLHKRLSKQPRRRWFETPSRSLWRHCNGLQLDSIWRWYMHVVLPGFIVTQPIKVNVQLACYNTKGQSKTKDISIQNKCLKKVFLTARFMGPTWSPSGSCRPQVGSM